MSRTFRKNPFLLDENKEKGFQRKIYQERRVSHSHTCFMCGKGRKAHRMLVSKPIRHANKKFLRDEIKDSED